MKRLYLLKYIINIDHEVLTEKSYKKHKDND